MCARTRKNPPRHKGSKKEKKGTEKNYKNSQETINIMAISTYLLIITLNVNRLTLPIKGRTAEWRETHFRRKSTQGLKVKGLKKTFHANGNERKLEKLHSYQTKWILKQRL